jgi:hypothetical protein
MSDGDLHSRLTLEGALKTVFRRLALVASTFGVLASIGFVTGCSSDSGDGPTDTTAEENLRVRGEAEWFYSGSLPTLENAAVTISLKGNTARVEGLLPLGASIDPNLPNVRSTQVNGRTQLDLVYPIATAAVYSNNAPSGTYAFQRAIPFRPDGNAYTVSAGNHFVTWGGFPFLAYDGGIAMHGPITDAASKTGGLDVWYLKRGTVSSGCNRMLGEHVIEVAQLTGIDMHKVFAANAAIYPSHPDHVTVISDYDQWNGKYIDVDYPTDVGVVRPGKVYGDDQVEMFGSWVGAELPDGSDLPKDLEWQGGVSGKLYVFKDHAAYNRVCSVMPTDLANLKAWAATQPNAEVPSDFCTRKNCIVAALEDGSDPNAICN